MMNNHRRTFSLLLIAAALIAGQADPAAADELDGFKARWRTARPILEKIKAQPRRYRDAIGRRDILGRIRRDRAAKGGKAGAVDTVRVLALKVQFQPDDDTLTAGNGHFDYAGNGQPMYVNSDPAQGHNLEYEPPHDSLYIHNQLLALRNYYWAVSGGKLWVEYGQYPQGLQQAYTLNHQMSFYSDYYNYGRNWGDGLYVLFRDAVAAADADPADISFRDYQSVMLFHAGACWQTDPYGADIPSVFIILDESSPILANAGRDSIYDGIIDAETQSQDGMVLGSQGEIAHEFGHQLGLPDLYDVSFYSVGLGEWDLMSHGSWNMNAYVPPHLSAWCKVFLGWSAPVELAPGTAVNQAFRWVAKDPDAIVKIPINSHEYYLVENRRAGVNPDTTINPAAPDSNGARVWRDGVLVKVDDYDMSLPFDLGRGGLLAWHVDEDLIQQRWYYNELEAGDIKAIHLEEADHIQDLQRWGGSPYATYASPYDAYYAGNNDRLDDGSDPASTANDGSYSHVSLSGVTAPDTLMHAVVRVGWGMPGFPAVLGDTVDWDSPTYAVLGPGPDSGRTILLQPGIRGMLYAWDATGQGYCNRETTFVFPNETVHRRAEFAAAGGYLYSSPAVGDIDRDGKPEVVVTTAISPVMGAVQAFRMNTHIVTVTTDSNNQYQANRALPVPGFPQTVPGPFFSSPLLADIDGDDTLEIVAAADDQRLHAWRHDGRAVAGFPADLGMETRSTAAAADLDPGRPGSEIVVLSGDSRVFAFSGDGRILPGFPVLQPWVGWVSPSVALGDLDRDGWPEIVACPQRSICALDRAGRALAGWPVPVDATVISSPALGDLDGDGYLEVAVAVGTKLCVYNYNGTPASGFPRQVAQGAVVQSSPVMADVDGDGTVEVVVASPDGAVWAFNGDGSTAAGFPLTIGGRSFAAPLWLDLDGDRATSELAVGCDDGRLYVWRLASAYGADQPWPAFHADPAHSGRAQWTAAGHPVAAAGDLLGNPYVYPSPARGSRAAIRFSLREAARVNIKIFNLAGDLVRSIDHDGRAATENEVVWDIDNVASGVYIVRIEASSSGTTQARICKTAVIQ